MNTPRGDEGDLAGHEFEHVDATGEPRCVHCHRDHLEVWTGNRYKPCEVAVSGNALPEDNTQPDEFRNVNRKTR